MPYIDSFNVGNVAYDIRDKYAGLYTANAYSSNATYAVGDLVTYDGKLYKCNTAIATAETWTPAHWTETTVAAITKTLQTEIDYNCVSGMPIFLTPFNTDNYISGALNVKKLGNVFRFAGTRGNDRYLDVTNGIWGNATIITNGQGEVISKHNGYLIIYGKGLGLLPCLASNGVIRYAIEAPGSNFPNIYTAYDVITYIITANTPYKLTLYANEIGAVSGAIGLSFIPDLPSDALALALENI